MTTMAPEKQESRTEVVSVAVTPGEKADIRAVASARDITNSDVLRDWTMRQVRVQAERIRSALDDDGQ